MVQKIALTFNDRLDNFVNRLATMLDVPEQIYCRAHLLPDEALGLIADALTQHLLILLTDPQTRTTIVSKIDNVLVGVFVELLNVNFRTDQNRFFGRISTPGIWIECLNKLKFTQ